MSKSKTIKIAHLYYDLMNLYGEVGNIKALQNFLDRLNIKYELFKYTIGDKIDFNSCDIYYMGMGTEHNQELALEDLRQYKDDIKDAINKDKIFLITGNAMEIFGSKIIKQNDEKINCLGIFDYYAFEEKERLISELHYYFSELSDNEGANIVGYKNASCSMKNVKGTIFEHGDNMRYKNFFAMNMIGPILVRNPYFTEYFLNIVFNQKGIDVTYDRNQIEYKAYDEFLKNFVINLE